MLSHPQSLTDFLIVSPNVGAVPGGFGRKGGSGTRGLNYSRDSGETPVN
jgi:hypothetical protein